MIDFALYSAITAILVVIILATEILRKSPGNELMQKISRKIQDGARAFLRREYTAVAIVVVIITLLLVSAPKLGSKVEVNWKTALSFLTGAIASGLAGYVAMSVGTRANSRTTEAAREGVTPALRVSFSAGVITGLSIVGIALLGLILVYRVFKGDPLAVNGYAMGASLLALFARAGGGIYTKGADMGADLVGKVEAGIPEDDPRNPAVIADNVGDNVGDTAGMGADLLESYVESIISALAIGYAIFLARKAGSNILYLPFAIAGWGILSSIIGVLITRWMKTSDPEKAMNTGVYTAAVLMVAGTYFLIKRSPVGFSNYPVFGPFWAVVSGLIAGLIIGAVSEFYTSYKYPPVRKLSESAMRGPAVTILGGMSIGMLSTLIPVVVIALATLICYKLSGMYGVALGSLGMLSILGITLAVDSYGPVADNAAGIAEMAGLGKEVREVCDKLDAVGNTTAAIGKGFAIGSAAFAALALITAYIATLNRFSPQPLTLSLTDPRLIAGLLIGGMVPFLFSSLLAGGVGRVANQIIDEVRRQFREIKGLMEGKAEADSTRCVDIAARGALRSMMLPGILAIIFPVGIGFTLGPVALGGFLIGALVTGLQLGIQMANTGAALDNAKKYIETGEFGGKGSEAHKSAVIGDTFGDPLKDTMGPSLNILIKLMSVISLVLAPLFLR